MKKLNRPSKLDSWSQNKLSISVKKRLEEVVKNMGTVQEKLDLKELQPYYDRLLSDRGDLNIWNELSFDMMTYESSNLIRYQKLQYESPELTTP